MENLEVKTNYYAEKKLFSKNVSIFFLNVHRFCVRDMMGEIYRIYAYTGINYVRWSTAHVAVCESMRKGFYISN